MMDNTSDDCLNKEGTDKEAHTNSENVFGTQSRTQTEQETNRPILEANEVGCDVTKANMSSCHVSEYEANDTTAKQEALLKACKRKFKLAYPVGRFIRRSRNGALAKRVSVEAAVFVVSVLNSATEELLRFAGGRVSDLVKKRIEPADLLFVITFKPISKMLPEMQMDKLQYMVFDRIEESDVKDSINTISENILEGKFKKKYFRFCSQSFVFEGTNSCRYKAGTCIHGLPDKEPSETQYIELNEHREFDADRQDKVIKKGFSFGNRLKKKYYKKLGPEATIYLTAVTKYITEELLELAGHCANAKKSERVEPVHLSLAFTSDEELNFLFPKKQLDTEAAVFLTAVMERVTSDFLKIAGKCATDFQRKRVEPSDLLFTIEGEEHLKDLLPSPIYGPCVLQNHTEIMKFKYQGKFLCSKKIVRSGVTVDNIHGSGFTIDMRPKRSDYGNQGISSSLTRRTISAYRKPRKGKWSRKVTAASVVCLISVIDHIITKAMEIAGDSAYKNNGRRIECKDLILTVGCNSDFGTYFQKTKF